MPEQAEKRRRMVERQIQARGVRDPRLLDAMRRVPREVFVPEALRQFAYDDTALPIEAGQTISQPWIVAMMIEAAEVRPGDLVLEVGAGSGYAAAVLGAMGAEVVAIERHDALVRLARERMLLLGYRNVDVLGGDGSQGLPDLAPFSAILVAAGGPEVPEPLLQQLAVGGHLVIPVGEPGAQSLRKITRTGPGTGPADFATQDLGAVRFVPLLGAHGWPDDGSRGASNHQAAAARGESLPDLIARAAEPLPDFDAPGFGALFDRFADRRVVLLGEASHGTSEFYRARAAITRRLVERHGFTIVAVEADWPDAALLDRYVRGRPGGERREAAFQRFPTWMWRNREVHEFIDWLRAHNARLPLENRTGFYGLDIYNMSASISAVLAYLDRVDPAAAATARERYGCLTPWQADPATYGRSALSRGYAECEAEVIAQCQALLSRELDYAAADGDAFLDAAQNARLVASAERYYRIMYYGGAESWNLRDRHMAETLDHLLDARGPDARAVVWAHNSHVGDARQTDMGTVRDELNLGQLARERWGHEAALIGLGTHTGTVAAASDWDGEREIKRVVPSRPDSYERLCHDSKVGRFLLDLAPGRHEALRRRLAEPLLERFIGVIYRPETERLSHYSTAVLPEQFDAWLWFDKTTAVTPLGPEHHKGTPETWPFGE